MELDLRRLIIRHRHVAPMVSALLAATNAQVRILDAGEGVILNREAGVAPDGPIQRFPVVAERQVLGWVEGGRIAGGIAVTLSYAAAREMDKRSLSHEALERYRELNLIYDLAQSIGAALEVAAVARVALDEAARLPGGGGAFLVLDGQADGSLRTPDGVEAGPIAAVRPGSGVVGAVADGEAEIVNDVGADPRATVDERSAGRSLIAAPLRVRGRRIGVIGAVTSASHDYRAADLKVMSAIAALAGPAIDQARAHEAAVGTASR